jgi:predicted nucleic acid-binding protein
MPASGKPTRTFLVDTNLFVAAVKDPRRETATLRFLIALLRREDLELIGNEYWAEELLRYAEAFRSETATWLAGALLDRARLVRVASRYVKLSSTYVTTPDTADVMHAATCLQERAILITNDRHFDRIRDEGIVEVWSIARALRSL